MWYYFECLLCCEKGLQLLNIFNVLCVCESITPAFNHLMAEGLFLVASLLVFCIEKVSQPPSIIRLAEALAAAT
jgi:hypothetical protein